MAVSEDGQTHWRAPCPRRPARTRGNKHTDRRTTGHRARGATTMTSPAACHVAPRPVSGLASEGSLLRFRCPRLPVHMHSGCCGTCLAYRCGGSSGIAAHAGMTRRTGFPFQPPDWPAVTSGGASVAACCDAIADRRDRPLVASGIRRRMACAGLFSCAGCASVPCRAPRSARWSRTPRPSGRRHAGAWSRCRSPRRGRVRRHRRSATTH